MNWFDEFNYPEVGRDPFGGRILYVEFDITDESTSTVTLSDGKCLIVYTRTPASDAARELIGYAAFDTALAPAGGTLLLDFATTGFVLIDYT